MLDTDQWVRTAVAAGARYALLTAKHGTGFCLWPTKVHDYHVGNAAVPRDVEDAARTLGDSEWRVFYRITLPLARRSLGAGMALGTARALGEFGVSLMIAGNIPGITQTLPLYIYSRAEALDFAAAHGAALLLAAVGVGTLLFVRYLEDGPHDHVV